MKKNDLLKHSSYLALLLFTSCVEKSNGDFGFADWFKNYVIILIVVLVIIFIVAIRRSNKEEKETTKILESRGLSQNDFKRVGRYVGGHPEQNDEILRMTVRGEGSRLYFYEYFGSVGMPKFKFEIEKDNIKDISIEDASSIEKKVTLGRVILVGIFALAWKKNKKNELAFVVVNWNDGRFDHSTTFVHEGANAMTTANSVRNQLIKMIN